ncbi:MAG: hypothetical protein P4L50_04290 [Anaerolineaceae bacterium]|nr:hypothetical protein [Anaerolineaceae bacterium]
MLHNSSYRDREDYNKSMLKEAQQRQRVRLAQAGNDENKIQAHRAASRSRNGLFSPVLRLVEFILITLGI